MGMRAYPIMCIKPRVFAHILHNRLELGQYLSAKEEDTVAENPRGALFSKASATLALLGAPQQGRRGPFSAPFGKRLGDIIFELS